MSGTRTAVVAALALGTLVHVAGVSAVLPPRALDAAEAGAGRPSAERAVARLLPEARVARPAGSEAGAALRERLLAELAALGLRTEVQRGELAGVPLVNLLARRAGGGDGGALLLVAHHDSVPRGEGAGDDGAGVAAVLEALAVTRDDPPPAHDVVVLLSDGEERGLLGARLFAREHPWFADVRAVVDVEGRGNAGPSTLFEVGPESGALLRAFVDATPSAFGDALGPAVYARMPNDTDFSVFREAGLPGLNLAFFAGASVYHRDGDTWDALRRDSVQHHAEALVGALRAAATLDLSAPEADAGRLTQVPGLGACLVPGAVGVALLVAAAGWWVLRIARGGAIAATGVRALGALVAEVGLLAAGVAAAWGLARALEVGARAVVAPGAPRGNLASAIAASIGGACVAWAAAWLACGPARRLGVRDRVAVLGASALPLALAGLAAATLVEGLLPCAALAALAAASDVALGGGPASERRSGARLLAGTLPVALGWLLVLPMQHLLAFVGSVAAGGDVLLGASVGALAIPTSGALRQALDARVRGAVGLVLLGAGTTALAVAAALAVRGL